MPELLKDMQMAGQFNVLKWFTRAVGGRWHAALVAIMVGVAGADAVNGGDDVEAVVASACVTEVRPAILVNGQQFNSDTADVSVDEMTLRVTLTAKSLVEKRAVIPRLCSTIRSMRWKQGDAALKFTPEISEWTFSWEHNAAEGDVIEVELEQSPTLLADCPPVRTAADGSIMLPAFQAATFGEKLRFEPQPFKNTVGYWTVPTDHASWKLTVDQPGTFSVAVLQGLGDGQGGSEAVVTLLSGESKIAELPFQPIETGHFQNFRWVHLGHIEIAAAGDHELHIKPVRIAKAALVDVRAVHLVRQAAARR